MIVGGEYQLMSHSTQSIFVYIIAWRANAVTFDAMLEECKVNQI